MPSVSGMAGNQQNFPANVPVVLPSVSTMYFVAIRVVFLLIGTTRSVTSLRAS